MNKVIKISISGCTFAMDIDAHKLLEEYIGSLKNKYGTSAENDMVTDIENRICELLSEKVATSDRVVTVEMVRSIIVQIGTVSSIERESLDTQSGVRFNFNSVKSSATNQIKDFGQEVANLIQKCVTGTMKIIVYIIIGIFSIFALAQFATLVYAIIIPSIYSELHNILEIDWAIYSIISTTILTIFIIALLYRILDRGKHIFSRGWCILSIFIFAVIFGVIGSVKGVKSYSKYSSKAEIEHISKHNYEDKEIVVCIDYRNNYNKYIEEDEKRYYVKKSNNGILDELNQIAKDGKGEIKVNVICHKSKRVDEVEIKTTKSSRGNSQADAVERAKAIADPQIYLSGDTIFVKRYINLNLKEGYRFQDVDVNIVVPKEYNYSYDRIY